MGVRYRRFAEITLLAAISLVLYYISCGIPRLHTQSPTTRVTVTDDARRITVQDSPIPKTHSTTPNFLDEASLRVPPQSLIQSRVQELGDLLFSSSSTCRRNRWSYVLPHLNAVVTMAPKSGTSNWKTALFLADGLIDIEISATMVDDIHKITLQYGLCSENGRKILQTMENYFTFAIVRNPWSRLISGYHDKLSPSSCKSQGGCFQGIIKEIMRLSQRGDDQEKYPTFQEYINWIIKTNGGTNGHFRPQMEMMCMQVMDYSYIAPLEYSRSVKSDISKILGVEINLYESYDHATDPREQISAKRAREWLSELDQETVQKVYSIYRADFAIMNYRNFSDPDFPLPNLTKPTKY